MSTQLSHREESIYAYDLSFVRERLLDEGKGSYEDWNRIDAEFKKFMCLVLNGTRPLAMIDLRVDAYWHTFVLFTEEYELFCRREMGFFVHHRPRTSRTPVPSSAIRNFVEAYKAKFGALAPLWSEELSPALQELIDRGSAPRDLAFKWSGWPGAE